MHHLASFDGVMSPFISYSKYNRQNKKKLSLVVLTQKRSESTLTSQDAGSWMPISRREYSSSAWGLPLFVTLMPKLLESCRGKFLAMYTSYHLQPNVNLTAARGSVASQMERIWKGRATVYRSGNCVGIEAGRHYEKAHAVGRVGGSMWWKFTGITTYATKILPI